MPPAYSFRKDPEKNAPKATVKASTADPNKQMKITDEGDYGRLRSIRIEPAENGFSVTSDHEPRANVKRVGKATASPESFQTSASAAPQYHVFEDAEGVLEHVKGKLAAKYDD